MAHITLMTLFKVTMRQGELIIKNPKKSYNKTFRLPLFEYLLLEIKDEISQQQEIKLEI